MRRSSRAGSFFSRWSVWAVEPPNIDGEELRPANSRTSRAGRTAARSWREKGRRSSPRHAPPGRSFLLVLVIVAPGLGAVAAGRHRAPAPLAGAAVVEEQPAAFRIGAAPYLVEARTGQQVAGGPQDGGQQGERRP